MKDAIIVSSYNNSIQNFKLLQQRVDGSFLHMAFSRFVTAVLALLGEEIVKIMIYFTHQVLLSA